MDLSIAPIERNAVTALLTIMLKGRAGQVYNVADEHAYCSIAEMAQRIAKANGIGVRFEISDERAHGYKALVFLFATDTRDYDVETRLYYPMENTSFPLAQDNIELMDDIVVFDAECDCARIGALLRERGMLRMDTRVNGWPN